MTVAVWTFSESARTADEVAAAGNEIANAAGGASVALELNEPRAQPNLAGKRLILKGKPGPLNSPELAAEAIFRAARAKSPSVVLIAATRKGREVAATLAAKLGAGCISEAYNLSISGNNLTAERGVYAGKIVAKVAAPLPCVATVKIGTYKAVSSSPSDTEEMDLGEFTPRVKVLRTEKREEGKVDLKSAKVIVSAGRGVKKKEDLPLLEGLANSLGGALGCSRPLSSDLGWLPEEHHIGLTGVSVGPELYLAVGISGQLQHIAGIKDSKVIAAINTDKEAPIFQASDYGVVGDLYQVIPALQKLLTERRR